MKNSSKWYSRSGMGFIAFLLTVIGIWLVIIFLPTAPLLSLLFFVLIGGSGVFIAHKQKNVFSTLFSGSLVASLGYLFCMAFVLIGVFSYGRASGAFFLDFAVMVIPIVTLGTLPLTWFIRKISGRTGLKSVLSTWGLCLVLIIPLVFVGIWDYNWRGDTSVPEVISMKVVDRGIHYEDGPWLDVEAPDRCIVEIWHAYVSRSFYDQHPIGSSIWVTVRKGALGYDWVENWEGSGTWQLGG